MEEKKLTDEVVVKALEHCSHNRSCEYCYHNDERGSGEIVCRSRLMGESLDLIHRLQKENEELKSPKFASWKLKFFNLKEEFDKELSEHEEFTKKAKAEIERLTEEKEDIRLFQLAMQNGEIDMLLESPMAKCFYDCIVQIFEQNGAKNFFTTTVELNGQKGRYAFTIEKTGGVTPAERIAELQKQVDKLENRFENKACCNMSENCSMIQQAEKDTAKEIIVELNRLKNIVRENYGVSEQVGVDMAINRVESYFKQKGVEVE